MLNSFRNSLPADSETLAVLLLTLFALTALLLLGWLLLALRLRRLNRRIHALTHGVEGGNLEDALTAHLATVARAERRMDSLEQTIGVLQAQMPECLRAANLVRYDAFEDVGGEQSFSLALLDARGNGVVLTSVYSRMDVRIYAKAVRDGQASHALSEAEIRALRGAAAR